MPLIDTSNKDVKFFKGLHLYHFWLSSCSQRVRIVLAEKDLDWVSHEIDSEKMEHATPEYQSIDPSKWLGPGACP
jgi:glutathione S-transferase